MAWSFADTATADKVSAFHLHLALAGIGISTRNAIMTVVKFLFYVKLRRHGLAAEIHHRCANRHRHTGG